MVLILFSFYEILLIPYKESIDSPYLAPIVRVAADIFFPYLVYCIEIEELCSHAALELSSYISVIALICQPMDGYAQKVAALQKNGATSTEIEGNRVTLKFDLDRDAMACLTIPYSSGWRVSVDGEPAKLVKANIAFMGVMLPKGAHTVEFSYMPKGLRLGAIISLGTLIALISVGLFLKLRRRRDTDASKG